MGVSLGSWVAYISIRKRIHGISDFFRRNFDFSKVRQQNIVGVFFSHDME